MSLIITIFLIALFTQLVNWIGKSVLLNIFYSIHQYIFQRQSVQRHRQLQKEILSTKQELLQTSAQDQFAKWAKLRRKVDKGLEELEKSNTSLSASKASYSKKFSVVLWCLTSGAQYGIGWMYGKKAVFYLPPGWFGPIQWWLAIPFAPLGSVSVGIWQMACSRVLRVLEGIVKDFTDLRDVQPESQPTEKASPETNLKTE
ncbi:hypothetical protein Clacol_000301 [Clathrus columnatus]|uniref:Guided entry of tail-anchored proteins 1 n=1 Tax=Clathrus columnatus TaxID=1419009 RepID=A0AAV4ZY63_9AGAM|nr:hypothetical protein Clacol_000301 [Clathrus columnatus]